MALITLGGVLKKWGLSAQLWDFDLYFNKVGNTTEQKFCYLLKNGVEASQSEIFAISAVCSNFPMALYIAKEIKKIKPNSMVIFGGPQPSSVPEPLLKRFRYVDIVCIGEGEKTLENLIQINFDRTKLSNVAGIGFQSESGAILTQKRPLISNLDEIPYPDYSLVNLEEYAQLHIGPRQVQIEVGRGCPFHCSFCSTAVMWENKFRVKSPERIFNEMEKLNTQYGFTEFEFIHDNFTTSRKFVRDFCEFMERENIKNFKWFGSSRTDCIDLPRLEAFHRAGARGLFFGIESGSEKIQKTIQKNLNFTPFEPILKRANELGMENTTAFILGFPEEGWEDVDASIIRALEYKCMGTQRVYFAKLSPLAGTRIYRENLEILEETAWPSTVSPQNYALPFINQLIQEHKDLFSSFYHVPHPVFSKNTLTRLVEFSHLLVNGNPQIGLTVIERLKIKPSHLFQMWDEWASEKDLIYFNYREFCEASFRAYFQEFLDERIFRCKSIFQIRKPNISTYPAIIG